MNSAIENVVTDRIGAIHCMGAESSDTALGGLSRLRCCVSIGVTPDPFGVKPILFKAQDCLSQPDYTINANYYAKSSLMARLSPSFSADPTVAEWDRY